MRLVGIFVVLLSVACTASVEAPSIEGIPDLYLHGQSAESQALEGWWNRFHDQQLDEMVYYALEGNPSLRETYARLEQADARYRQLSSGFWPSIDFGGTVDRQRFNFRFSGAGGQNQALRPTNTNYQVSLPVSYELDLWGRVRKDVQAGAAALRASREDYLAATVAITSQVVENYFLVAELCEQLALLDQTISSDQNFYQVTITRYRDGIAGPLDVHQAKQNLAASLARRPEIFGNLKASQHSLKVLLGTYPDSNLECQGREIPRQFQTLATGVPSELLLQRPDIRASLERIRAQDARVAEAIRSRFPKIVLTALGAYGSEEFEDLIDPDNLIWRVAADLSFSLFDAGRKAAEVDLQKAIEKELRARYVGTVLQGFEEVENALVRVEQRRERVTLLEKKEKAVGSSLNLAVTEYLQGIREYLPVLVTQASYYNARSELLTARREYISAHVQLARALGGGWSEEEAFSVRENE